jgi:hypothetical protein
MSVDKKITPSDLRDEAERLIAAGKMPPLEEVLKHVADAREKYAPQIKSSRENVDGENN